MAAAAGAAVEQPQPREWQKDAAREIWEVGGFALPRSLLPAGVAVNDLPAHGSLCVTLFSLLSLPAAMPSPGQTLTTGSPPRT